MEETNETQETTAIKSSQDAQESEMEKNESPVENSAKAEDGSIATGANGEGCDFSDPDSLIGAFAKRRSNVFFFLREGYTAPPASTKEVRNILVHTDHANWHTGHFAAVCSMAVQLKELGYNPTLCFCKKPPAEAVPEGIPYVVQRIIGVTQEGFRGRIESYRTIIEENEIDTVILNSWQGSYKYWDLLILQNQVACKDGRRVRVLLHFHSSFAKPQFELGSNWLRLNTEVVKHFDGLIVNNEVDATFWRTFHPRVYYRPLPVEDVQISEGIATREPHTAIYVARYSGTKNQIAAINAFKHVVNKIPDAKLVLAGDDQDEYQEKCRARIEKLELGDNVELLGFVGGEDKDRLFRTATLAINTSRFEGFSIYLCEAKAYGLPIVTYGLPNLTVLDGAEKNGAIVSPKDEPKKLAAQIVRVMEDPALQKRLGSASRAHFEVLRGFDFEAFWKDVFEDMRHEMPPLEEWTPQQRIYASLFDALLTASRSRGKKQGAVAALKRKYRKGPDTLKKMYRKLREAAYKATH